MPNRHYYAQGLYENNRTVKKDFVVCRNSSFETLKKYCETDNYKNISLDSYLYDYAKYSYDVIESMAIKDNFYSDANILAPPYIYQDIYGDVFADLGTFD